MKRNLFKCLTRAFNKTGCAKVFRIYAEGVLFFPYASLRALLIAVVYVVNAEPSQMTGLSRLSGFSHIYYEIH